MIKIFAARKQFFEIRNYQEKTLAVLIFAMSVVVVSGRAYSDESVTLFGKFRAKDSCEGLRSFSDGAVLEPIKIVLKRTEMDAVLVGDWTKTYEIDGGKRLVAIEVTKGLIKPNDGYFLTVRMLDDTPKIAVTKFQTQLYLKSMKDFRVPMSMSEGEQTHYNCPSFILASDRKLR